MTPASAPTTRCPRGRVRTARRHLLGRAILVASMLLIAAAGLADETTAAESALHSGTPPPLPTLEHRHRLITAEHAAYGITWEQGELRGGAPPADDAAPPWRHGLRAIHDEYDVSHYDVALDLDIPGQIVTGTVVAEASAQIADLDAVDLDLYDCMTVDGVSVNGSPAFHIHNDGFLTVFLDATYQPGENFTIACDYHGHPYLPGASQPFRWAYQHGNPMVLTYSEPYGAPAWWLCKDDPKDKATYGIHITCPDSLFAVSNGYLDGIVDHGDGTATYNWITNYPMSPYLFSIAVTKYAHWSETYTGLDGTSTMGVDYWPYPADSADAAVDWRRNIEMMEFCAQLFGEYPFMDEKYAIAEFAHPGAMEHQTATSMGGWWITGNNSNDFVVLHELSHSWVGDMITMTEWSHAWCKEGYATYCEALWFEDLYGENYYHAYMRAMDPLHYGQYQLYGIDPPLHGAIYYKGAWVLHMLRHVIGDDAFRDGCYAYTNDPDFRYDVADTEDLRGVFEDVSGMGLTWFFDQWIYHPGYPTYRYHWWSEETDRRSYDVSVLLRQIQEDAPVFTMPIDIAVETVAGTDTFVVWNSEEVQLFVLSVANEPLGVEIDPNIWIIRATEPMSGVDTDDPDVLVDGSRVGVFQAPRTLPNPFRRQAWIGLGLSAETQVELDLFDAAGRRITELFRGSLPAGRSRIPWNGSDIGGRRIPAGAYFLRWRAGGRAGSERLIILD